MKTAGKKTPKWRIALGNAAFMLGQPSGDYVKTRRGIEPPKPSDASDAQRDAVIFSDDRRTLSVDLSAGAATDQI
jgi:hypothetical protein